MPLFLIINTTGGITCYNRTVVGSTGAGPSPPPLTVDLRKRYYLWGCWVRSFPELSAQGSTITERFVRRGVHAGETIASVN